MRVSDVMVKGPCTIDPEATLGTAMDVMRTKELRHLPVVNGAGELVGIITDRDLRQACFSPVVAEYLSGRAQRSIRQLGKELEDVRVRDFMTWNVVTVHPDASVAHAALIMSERRLGSLPVVKNGTLVGMLTERDVLHALNEEGRVLRFRPEGFLW